VSKFAEYVPGRGESGPLSAANGLVIRPALQSDLRELAEIAAEREEESSEHWLRAFERIYDESLQGRGTIIVGALTGEIAGYAKVGYFIPAEGSPANVAPEGWYLSGVVVRPLYRRRGLGGQLTRARLVWIAGRADKAYYFANERNRVSIELHRDLGFLELSRDFYHPRAQFEGGRGILFVCDLYPWKSQA
jgi:ribosomal protein S18 acetylase RimI-like enzyme